MAEFVQKNPVTMATVDLLLWEIGQSDSNLRVTSGLWGIIPNMPPRTDILWIILQVLQSMDILLIF